MRIPGGVSGIETDKPQKLVDALGTCGPGGQPVDVQCLADDCGHAQVGIERAVGILKHDLHPTPQRAEGGASQVSNGLAVKPDIA